MTSALVFALLAGRVASATVAPTLLPPAPAEIRTADRCIEDRACAGHPIPWACLSGCIERERDDWEVRARRLERDLATVERSLAQVRAELAGRPAPILGALGPAAGPEPLLPGWAWGLIGLGVGVGAGAFLVAATR